MTRSAIFLAGLLAACCAQAQMECRTNPQDPDLEFSAQAGGRTLEFRGKSAARNLGRSCVLTLNCTEIGRAHV